MCGAHRRLVTSRDRVEETLTKDGSLSALHGEAPVTSPDRARDHEKLSELGFFASISSNTSYTLYIRPEGASTVLIRLLVASRDRVEPKLNFSSNLA